MNFGKLVQNMKRIVSECVASIYITVWQERRYQGETQTHGFSSTCVYVFKFVRKRTMLSTENKNQAGAKMADRFKKIEKLAKYTLMF